MRTVKNFILCIILASIISSLIGCGNTPEAGSGTQDNEVQQELFAMDTYMTLTAYGDNAQEAVDKAVEEIERLDALLSTGDSESEIAKLNESGSAELSGDAGYLIERSLELYEETDKAFDITVYPIMEAWGFTTESYRVPSESELRELLKLVDASGIEYDKESRRVELDKSGMKIDLGGIAKGYTSSRIMDIYRECGVESGMVNLGGNVQTLGSKPDGNSWRVAIQSPDGEDQYLGILETQDKAVITSGGYERYFEKDGITYHHIIDPSTGRPADKDLISVTIVSEDGTLADGLSTSLFIMGKDKAIEFWRTHSDEFDAVLQTGDGTLYVTEGILEAFDSELKTEAVKKQ